jgi:oxygen-independent coproporphyrinogen-3 oxidase
MACAPLKTTPVEFREALEETFFLGLRMTRGVDLIDVSREYGAEAVNSLMPIISELEASKLLVRDRNVIRLTPRGRLLSNEVFERFISPAERV